jgi:hypothetical protein
MGGLAGLGEMLDGDDGDGATQDLSGSVEGGQAAAAAGRER